MNLQLKNNQDFDTNNNYTIERLPKGEYRDGAFTNCNFENLVLVIVLS